MNYRTFLSSKWTVGAVGAIIISTLVFKNSAIKAQASGGIVAPSNSVAAQVTVKAENDLVPAVSNPPAPVADAPVPAAPAAPAVQTIAPAIPEDLSPGLSEVVRLVQAHVGDDVILAYLKNSAYVYHPTADEIVYLNDLGVSDKVLTAILEHSKMEPGTSIAGTAPGSTPDPASAPAVAPSPTLTGAPAPTYSVSTAAPEASAPPPPPPAAPAPAVAVVAPAAPVQPVTVEYFRTSLAPYGTWVWVADYGWCWQPTAVVLDAGWAPYCDRGRWVYTDCGWYWESDYSWGWAPFHYGRWSRHGYYGWVWVPDTVWGPSWVCWRHQDAYCGWAPLPPAAHFEVGVGFTFNHGHVGVGFGFGLAESCFTFVAYDHFCDRHPGHYRLPPHERTVVFQKSTVINNYTVNKTTIINEGVGRNRVAAITHQNIEPVSIHHVPVAPSAQPRGEHLENGGRSLTVYHPQVAATPAGRTGPSGSSGFAPAAATRTPVLINHTTSPVSPANSGASVNRVAPGRITPNTGGTVTGRPSADNSIAGAHTSPMASADRVSPRTPTVATRPTQPSPSTTVTPSRPATTVTQPTTVRATPSQPAVRPSAPVRNDVVTSPRTSPAPVPQNYGNAAPAHTPSYTPPSPAASRTYSPTPRVAPTPSAGSSGHYGTGGAGGGNRSGF